ncbi:MAG: hypothetical protein R2758_09825 [Bacteroidales bacterium]
MEAIRGLNFATFDQATADLVASKATAVPLHPVRLIPWISPRSASRSMTITNGGQAAGPSWHWPFFSLSGVQHYAETADRMATVPEYVRDMMKKIPVSWDETRFIDGYRAVISFSQDEKEPAGS